MTTTRRKDVGPAVFLGEHRAILAAVLSLKAHIRGPDPARHDQWIRRLAADLEVLAGLLRPHFAREEEQGMFDAIVQAEPAAIKECARLRGQHGAILEHLSAIARKLEASRHDPGSVEMLRRETRAMLADLARHEAAEDGLLVRVMEGEEVAAAD
jgi:hypothetical protein